MPRAVQPQPPDVVQKLLAEIRELRVQVERHRLDAEEARGRVGRPDPRLAQLEREVARLRAELSVTREERDALLAGVRDVLAEMKKGRR